MFCNHCGNKFEVWKTKYGWMQKDLCSSCHEIQWEQKSNRKEKDAFCVKCGELLPKHLMRTKTGKTYYTSAPNLYCDQCKQPVVKIKRKCIVCEAILVGKAHKYCPDHKPASPKINPITNRRSSIAWAKNNPQKVNAAVFARTHSSEIYVLYECRCDHPRKHNHHFNYKFKNIVIRLCPTCHAAEHARLRSLAA